MRQNKTALWSGMGTGKTVSTLTALEMLIKLFGEGPALVVAPLRVARSTWPGEVGKWSHLQGLTVSVICGTPKQREAALAAKADVYCTNFEQLPWLVERIGIDAWPFRIVVVDEATRLKGFRLRQGSSRAKALAKVVKHVDRFIELTGTPAANGLLDLWGQMWFLDGGKRLGTSMQAYEYAYFRPIRTGDEPYMVKWVPLSGSESAIKAKLADIALTVNAEDYFDIDEPVMNVISVELPPKARRVYKELETTLFAALESGESVEAANARSALTKCLQVASGAIYTDADRKSWEVLHDAKLDALKSVVEEAAGAPVLVAYQFRHELERIRKAFPQARVLDSDPATIDAWNAGSIPLLLAHPAACGHGLNLQDGGSILCFYSLGWNYEHYSQMIERIGPTRQMQAGHPRPVFVHHIIAEQTVEQAVMQALQKKDDVLRFLLGKK